MLLQGYLITVCETLLACMGVFRAGTTTARPVIVLELLLTIVVLKLRRVQLAEAKQYRKAAGQHCWLINCSRVCDLYLQRLHLNL